MVSKSLKYYYSNHESNKNKMIARNKARKRANKLKIFSYLKDHPCVHCNESDVFVLDFDHLDPSNKKDTISNLLRKYSSWDNIEKEIEKCQVLCANCHRIKTAKDNNWYPNLSFPQSDF